MLQLKNIHKIYSQGTNEVRALRGIDLSFRKSDFVSILGPSGCGKTTMLNIIGGLDQYTEGDLVIDGRSTKDFKDRDWDGYRNHSIGFVFQTYNLIPHQTVLQNVEIALSIGGVSKKERRRRAIEALEQVGLGDQLKKRPSQMSGGQMQRVAIARALVTNPEIILADEPTGALDTETSVQVMEILKEISKERLVIMVTHNPELAEKYSTRIIRMLDGQITDDSAPLSKKELEQYDLEDRAAQLKAREQKKVRKPSMSFATAFMLSLKNLFTKKGRTTLTAFAGSIGIIGIALILAVSQGMTAYIDGVQESTLSNYPLTLEASTMDMTSLMEAFMGIVDEQGSNAGGDNVYKKSSIFDMVDAMNSVEQQENDLKSFKEFLDKELKNKESELSKAVNGVQYGYDLNLEIYTESVDGKIMRTDLEKVLMDLMLQYVGIDMSTVTSMSEMTGMDMMAPQVKLWSELLPGDNGAPVNDLLLEQYDKIYGSWPNSYDEVVLVVDKNNEIDDLTLYAMGLISEEEIDQIAVAAVNRTELGEKVESSWSYEEICNTQFRVILNSDCYTYNESTDSWIDLRESDASMRVLYAEKSIPLRVVGIIRPNEEADSHMLKSNICYTHYLTEYVIEKSHEAEVVKQQLNNSNRDVLSGLPFDTTTGTLTAQQKEEAFRAYIAELTPEQKAQTYVEINCIPPQALIDEQLAAVMENATREQVEATMLENIGTQVDLSKEELENYLTSMTDEDLFEIYEQMVIQGITMEYAQNVAQQFAGMTPEQLLGGLEMAMQGYTTEDCARYYDAIVEFSDSTYEYNLQKLGYVELDSPATINIYASSFENKDVIVEAIDDYNNNVEEMQKIRYTDYLGIMMSSITTIINAISYVLIAFVSISLIVSSIMIGVITLISVQERTKEIGILRAIGASKRNVSSMFNAETVIVGLAAGLLGVGVTYLLIIPINYILLTLTGIANLKAILPINAAAVLVLISVVLTLISGLIPSRSAAKKDPVVALRTE